MDSDKASPRKKARYGAIVKALESEISLFWQRSLFFWGFIGAGFVAFAAAKDSHIIIQSIIASFGFVCSVAWTLANRGSKFWYENWEARRRLAEFPVTGMLYGSDPQQRSPTGVCWLRGARYSPSRLVIALSDYVAMLWLALVVSRVWLLVDLFYVRSGIAHSRLWATLAFVGFSVVYALCLLKACYSKNKETDREE